MKVKELLKGLATILGYLYIPVLIQLIFLEPLKSLNDFTLSLVLLVIQLFVTILIIICYYQDLKKEFNEFKENALDNFIINFKYYLAGLAGMLLFNMIIVTFFSTNIATNEASNRQIISSMPLYALTSIMFIGPICEEIAFRKSFSKAFNSSIIFIIFTSILFGGAHIINDLTFPNTLYILSYTSLGLALGYSYKKSNNIFTSISLHMFHNIFVVLILLLSL